MPARGFGQEGGGEGRLAVVGVQVKAQLLHHLLDHRLGQAAQE